MKDRKIKDLKALSLEEIISLAINSEFEAKKTYTILKDKILNKLLRQKLELLIAEEEKHAQLLKRLFHQRFPHQQIKASEKSLWPSPQIKLEETGSVVDLFNLALKAEETFEKFYSQASRTVTTKEERQIFRYLSRVERTHFFMIQSEVDLLQRFPDYYQVEDFHFGDDLFHIGP